MSDSDDYEYEDEDEDEDENPISNLWDELVYEPEDLSPTKYTIVLCELQHFKINKKVYHHYLTMLRVKQFNFEFIDWAKQTNFIDSKVEIAQCVYLPSGFCISILKTHWIKIIQRVWKRIVGEKTAIIVLRCKPNALKYREIHGKWPVECSKMPSLKGMLSNLSRSSS